MANKVYWITLATVLNGAKRYIQRNDIKLSQNLTTEQYNCVVDTLNAIISCLLILPTNTPV